MANLNEMTAKELKEMAKELKISNWWTKNKAQLIADIEERQNMSDEEKKALAEEKAKEDAALAIYNKHWRKYTERYNVDEFLEKWKSGEIVLETEEPIAEEKPAESIEEIVGQDTLEEQERDEKETKASKKKASKEKKASGEKASRGKQIEYDGRSMNLNEWAKELGMTRQTLYARLYIQNWDVEKAFTTPGRKAK